MTRWNKANVPHKGWKHIGIEDLGEDAYPGEEIRYEQCEMCGYEKIRYVHILIHPDFDGELIEGQTFFVRNGRENQKPVIILFVIEVNVLLL